MNELVVPASCHNAWWDGKQSHVCRQDKGHEPPCKCRYCGHIEGERPRIGTAGGPE